MQTSAYSSHNSPSVSIVIPVYNSARYLQRCMESILAQSLSGLEVICINDGSTDDSLRILQRYKKLDRRVKIISQKNKTAGAARNLGLSRASGEYVIFLDSDDFFDPKLAERAYAAASTHRADIAVFKYRLYYSRKKGLGKRSWGIHAKNLPKVFSPLALPSKKLLFTNIAVWNKAYRREFLLRNKIVFEPRVSLNDVCFSWSALALAERVCVLESVLTFYRVNSGASLTDRGFWQARDHFQAFTKVESVIRRSKKWDKLAYDFKVAQINQFYFFVRRLIRFKATALENVDRLRCERNYRRSLKKYLLKSLLGIPGKEKIFSSFRYKFIMDWLAESQH